MTKQEKVAAWLKELKFNKPVAGQYGLYWSHPSGIDIIEEQATFFYEVAEAAKVELIDNLDDIANKPWRAIRTLAEIFESLPGDYNAECAKEYRKLEAFYSNGGRAQIDRLLADRTFNKNYPELLSHLKQEGKLDE